MLFDALIGFTVVSATVLVHAVGTAWWLKLVRNRYSDRAESDVQRSTVLHVLIKTSVFLITLHVVEVFLWALAFYLLPGSGLHTLEEAMYFSFTTYTTLGYGDITLAETWRLLTGIESLNGMLLIGWSTALSFAVIQRIWEGPDSAKDV